MNAARVAAAALLGAGCYVIWQQGQIDSQAPATGADWIDTTVDTAAEAVNAYLGVDMKSSRYTAALANPANSAIIGMLTNAEMANGIPAGLLVRQAWQESRFNPMAVNKVSGAKGLMQFMDATADEWGVSVFDPQSSADGAGRYMAWIYRRVGSWGGALAAYNWGIGNLARKGMALAPAETVSYVSDILNDAGMA